MVCLSTSVRSLCALPAEMFVKEIGDHSQPDLVVELGSTVFCTRKNQELRAEPGGLVGVLEFMRLGDGHLGICVAMNERQWRILGVQMHHWTGEFGQGWLFFRQTPKKQLQCGNADAQTELRALSENTFKVRGPVETDDGIHLTALIQMIADLAFQPGMAMGDSSKCREMTSCRRADDGDAAGIQAELVRMRLQETDRSLDVMNLRRKLRLSR